MSGINQVHRRDYSFTHRTKLTGTADNAEYRKALSMLSP
jgi:hypothetical protein